MADVFTHPWLGGLFGDDQLHALLAPDRQLQHMLTIEKAYTTALRKAGRITGEDASAVTAILTDPDLDMHALHDGTGTDGMIVPALIRQLKAKLPEASRDALHSGLTSQDVIDTALALTLKAIIPLFATRLDDIGIALVELATTQGDRSIIGRTRMQAALPISVRDRVDIWRLPLVTHGERLQALRPRVEILSIGGPVGTRPVDDVAQHMAQDLGLALPDKAPHAMRDHLAELAGLLSLMTGSLGKFGQDVALMAQQGIDEVRLSGGGRSSAMAHKANPIRAELLVTLARFNATQLSGMHHTLIHEQERSGVAWALEWMLLPQMLQATGAALLSARQLVEDISDIGTD